MACCADQHAVDRAPTPRALTTATTPERCRGLQRCAVWRWWGEQGQEPGLIRADGLAHIVGEDALRRVDGSLLSVDAKPDPFAPEIVQEDGCGHQKNPSEKNR